MEISKAEERSFLAIEAMENTIASMQKTADDFAQNSARALQQYTKGSVFAKESFESTVRKEMESYAHNAANVQREWQREIREKIDADISKKTYLKIYGGIIACAVIAIVSLQIYASSFQSDIVAAKQELAAIKEQKKLAQDSETVIMSYGGKYIQRQNGERGIALPAETKVKRFENGTLFITK